MLAAPAYTPHAPANDDPWFNPPGGTWVPDAQVVSEMKAAVDERLAPVLAGKGDSSLAPVKYWFQYIGNGSGVDKTIAIVGRPFPVSRGADAVYLGAVIPESCHVFGNYVPKERKLEAFSVGGFHCPPRI
jgi:hypothetical protein